MPLVRGLSLPLCKPTMIAAPVGGKPFIDRLEPKDVMAGQLADDALACVLLGFAQVKPEGARKVAMTREPSEDVIVRLYQESPNGLIFPTWVLARSNREAAAGFMPMEPTISEEGATENDGERKSPTEMFCYFVAKALASQLKTLNGRPVAQRLSVLVRSLTGRNLEHSSLEDKDKAWEQLLQSVVEHRPVFGVSKDTNPQHAKFRRFSTNAPLCVLEAFELRGERYVCVFDAHGAADGSSPTPRDMLLDDFLSELDGLYTVV